MSEITFLFVSDSEVGAPLENGEGVMVLDPEGAHYVTDALICNELYRSKVFAPEINWYLKQTVAEKEEKKEVLKQLYAMRLVRYNHAPKKVYALNIDRTVMIIGESEEALGFVESAKRYFDVTHIFSSKLLHLEGKFGGFKARFLQSVEDEEGIKEHEVEATCAQLVLCDQQSDKSKYRGVSSVMDYSDTEAILRSIRNRIGYYEYKNTITYDVSLCTYHHNEASLCAQCAQMCPSFGIVNDDVAKELHFSALDCIACGKCVSVCPSGALDFAPFSKKAFVEVATMCKGKKVLLIAETSLKTLEGCEIPSGYVPFVVETDQFLSSFHLQNVFEKSGHTVLFYTPNISEATYEALRTLNETSLHAHNGKAVELVQTKEAFEAYCAFTCKEGSACPQTNEHTQRIYHG